MKITRRVRVSIIYLALAIGMLVAPAATISLATAGSATAAPIASTIPLRGHSGHDGGDGFGSGGVPVGPSSTYSRGHDEGWAYGAGILDVPRVDTTVHQSR
jgi:hypothetical protein